MQQSVATREDRHKGTELGRVDDLALVHRTDFSGRRVENHLHAALGFGHGATILGTNCHGANDTVVVHGNVGTRLLLEGVDDLALRSNDLTNLVDRNLNRDDLRRHGGHFLARCGNGLGDHVQNLQTSVLRLAQGLSENFGRKTVDLGVELQCRHGVSGSSDLEVHVTKGVFGTEDVSQRHVLAVVVDQTHRDAGNGSLNRHTGSHQRQSRATDRRHRS